MRVKKEKFDINILRDYVPADSIPIFENIFSEHTFTLIIKRPRLSRLGDFRVYPGGKIVITINCDLNPYAFAITFLHEVAHMIVWKNHGRRVKAHGPHWKREFAILLEELLEIKLPADVRNAVLSYMKNPKASSCSDDNLLRTLNGHNFEKKGTIYLEELEEGDIFTLRSGRKFIRGKKRRTRVICEEFYSKKKYLISVVAEVKPEPGQLSIF